MSEATFRTAAAPAAPAPVLAEPATPEPKPGVLEGPSTVDSSVTTDSALFATFEDDQHMPYSAQYFDVPAVWDREPSLSRDLREIEGYMREQVSKGRLENSTKAANAFLKELERKAELTRYESTPQRIAKLLSYIDFRRTVDG